MTTYTNYQYKDTTSPRILLWSWANSLPHGYDQDGDLDLVIRVHVSINGTLFKNSSKDETRQTPIFDTPIKIRWRHAEMFPSPIEGD